MAETKKNNRNFDFTRFAKRRIALMVTYLGWDYDGVMVQDSTENTIEAVLFKGPSIRGLRSLTCPLTCLKVSRNLRMIPKALEKVKLIESRESCMFERCGRTDKGVSAYQQVFSLEVRSNLTNGFGVYIPDGYRNSSKSSEMNQNELVTEGTSEVRNTLEESIGPEEINYCLVLNRVLPHEIRILAWAPVNGDFSARFNCTRRVYKYFFPRGDLNLQNMEIAAQYLIGSHDFRNFCKPERDKSKIQNFVREIKDVSLREKNEDSHVYQMCELTIVGSGFLWHQIRYTVNVLLAVGEGKEPTQIVKELLDVEKVPRRPQYEMAADFPLCLFECCYELGSQIAWQWAPDVVRACVMRNLQKKWAEHSIKATMIRSMLEDLSSKFGHIPHQTDIVYPANRPKNHVPFLKRPTSAVNIEDVQEKQTVRKRNKV